MLLQAFESGINFFDTADHYSQGHSERLLGEAFKGRRDQIIIATKGGAVYSPIGGFALRMRPLLRPLSGMLRPLHLYLHRLRGSQRGHDFSPKQLTQAIHGSLKRLQTDYLDLFQLHKPASSILEQGDFCETLERLKAQGKVRFYGVACDSVYDALICLKYPGISSLQVSINLLEQEAVSELLPLAHAAQVAIVARNPRARGHLTDHFSDIMAETYAKNQREFEENKKKAEQYRFLKKENRSLAQAAIQFVLQLPGVSVVAPRTLDRRHLQEHLHVQQLPPLSQEELGRIASMGR